MFKFSKLIKEDVEFEDIVDALLPISDVLGQPKKVTKTNIGKDISYMMRWDLDFNISLFNGIEVLDKLTKLMNSISELKYAQRNLNKFMLDFKMDNTNLYIRLIPKMSDSEPENYQFIVGQNGREIIIRYSEIIRFYRDNDIKILNIEYIDDEINQMCSLYLKTEEAMDVNNKFGRLLNDELEKKEKSISKDISVTTYSKEIYINPEDEKTYIILDIAI